MPASNAPNAEFPWRSRPDWRGWIALAWAVVWGSAYAVTAFHARAPLVMAWIKHVTENRWGQ